MFFRTKNNEGVSAMVLLMVIGAMLVSFFYLRVREGERAEGVVRVKGATLTVEIARTQEERAQGLSGRRELAEGQGMLFVFPSADMHGFWMKDMRFPIDIIWMQGNKVVDIEKSVPPPNGGPLIILYPEVSADVVLETRAGFADAVRLTVGDAVEWSYQ